MKKLVINLAFESSILERYTWNCLPSPGYGTNKHVFVNLMSLKVFKLFDNFLKTRKHFITHNFTDCPTFFFVK